MKLFPPDLARRQEFIRALAVYLAGDQARKSIELEAHVRSGGVIYRDAPTWARVRSASPLFGYPTLAEAEQQLAEWLGIPL